MAVAPDRRREASTESSRTSPSSVIENGSHTSGMHRQVGIRAFVAVLRRHEAPGARELDRQERGNSIADSQSEEDAAGDEEAFVAILGADADDEESDSQKRQEDRAADGQEDAVAGPRLWHRSQTLHELTAAVGLQETDEFRSRSESFDHLALNFRLHPGDALSRTRSVRHDDRHHGEKCD